MRDGVCRTYSSTRGALCLSCLLACLPACLLCLVSPRFALSRLTFLVNLPAGRTAGHRAYLRASPSLLPFPPNLFAHPPSFSLFLRYHSSFPRSIGRERTVSRGRRGSDAGWRERSKLRGRNLGVRRKYAYREGFPVASLIVGEDKLTRRYSAQWGGPLLFSPRRSLVL